MSLPKLKPPVKIRSPRRMVEQAVHIADDSLMVVMPIAVLTPQQNNGWRSSAATAKRDRNCVRAMVTSLLRAFWYREAKVIRIERWAPRMLDTDNLVRATKNLRDGVLDSLTGTTQGHLADGAGNDFEFVCAQTAHPAYGVCLTLYRDMDAHGPIERGDVWLRG